MSLKNSKSIPIVVDTDNAFGMPVRDLDDGIALIVSLVSEQIDVKAIVASACNCRAYEAARNTLYLLKQFGMTHIPVGLGAETPLSGDRGLHHQFLDAKAAGTGATYWDTAPVIPDVDVSGLPSGVDVLIDVVQKNPHEVVVVALGSFTNLALALRKAPDIAPLIKEVVHMGGTFEPREGELAFEWDTADIPPEVWETTLRFNTWYDKQATAEVLQAGIPVRFISANVTSHVYLRDTHLQEMRSVARGALGEYLIRSIEPWLKWSIAERKLVGAHMHDPLAMFALLNTSVCTYRCMNADIPSFLAGYELFPQEARSLCKSADYATMLKVKVAVNVDTAWAEKSLCDFLCRAVSLESNV
ncbi:nucleoside hydrolase [Halodesulfovibrio marinisediminis]|uniref:Purine nucleosidase n=1 Tax=Halodesulfovibrio marinisediminis DSM 17456 TaxID=1121457 RepID=A0A1N6HCR8_9BACT|nr:nucleoside hydrolase [Halodesulfovibrio marinisediminis]SIO17570.1 purine nucleosidase [Halodesulfovibrio marinisediminis DSM 17456]